MKPCQCSAPVTPPPTPLQLPATATLTTHIYIFIPPEVLARIRKKITTIYINICCVILELTQVHQVHHHGATAILCRTGSRPGLVCSRWQAMRGGLLCATFLLRLRLRSSLLVVLVEPALKKKTKNCYS